MAEIFGAVASGAGLVSLSMQLIESAQKLKSFYSASRDAPNTVADLCHELETVSLNLRLLESHRQNNILGDEMLERCVAICARMVARIQVAVDKMGSLMNRSRFAGRLYTAFKEPEMKQSLEELERAKSSLLAACMGYYHSHSILEAARNNAILQAQSEMLSSYRDQLRQIEDRLETRTITHEKQPSTAVTNLLPINTKATRLAHRSNHQLTLPKILEPSRRKFRVSLPRWFTNCVWEFGMCEAGEGWIFQLRPVNYRPYDSLVFEVVRLGSVQAVRRLLDSGELSARDCESGRSDPWDILTIAASRGRIDLCDFLLQEFPSFREDTVLKRALEAFIDFFSRLSRVGYQSRTEAMYRLFIGKYGLDVDLDNASYHQHRPRELGQAMSASSIQNNFLLTADCLRTISDSQLVPFAQRPLAQRFALTVNSQGQLSRNFIRLVSPDDPGQLAFRTDDHGKTALHWAAEQSQYSWQGEDNRSSASLVTELLRMGANLHALTSTHETPLTKMLLAMSSRNLKLLEDKNGSVLPDEMVKSAIKQWGVLLAESGISGHLLQNYASAETTLQRRLNEMGHWYQWSENGWFTVRELLVLDDLHLGINICHGTGIKTWTYRPPPGTWLTSAYYPSTICWAPSRDFEGKDCYLWQSEGVHSIQPAPVESRRELQSCSMSLMQVSNGAWKDLFTGTQDDHGPVARMLPRYLLNIERNIVLRDSLPHERQRFSHSSPFPVSEFERVCSRSVGYLWERIRGPKHWVHSVEKCMLDGKWKIGPPSWENLEFHERQCMHGCYTHDTSRIWWLTDFWVAELLEDRITQELAERFVARFWPEAMDVVNFKLADMDQDAKLQAFLEV
ncbi:hypothetical protein Q7P37_008790 [Cladosporium fusiforme]